MRTHWPMPLRIPTRLETALLWVSIVAFQCLNGWMCYGLKTPNGNTVNTVTRWAMFATLSIPFFMVAIFFHMITTWQIFEGRARRRWESLTYEQQEAEHNDAINDWYIATHGYPLYSNRWAQKQRANNLPHCKIAAVRAGAAGGAK
jgi:hypothetical protein